MEFNEQSQVKWPLVPLHSKSAIVCKKLLFMANKTALSNWKKTSEATTIYNHLCSSSTLDLHFNRIFQQIINLWTNIDFGQQEEFHNLKFKRLIQDWNLQLKDFLKTKFNTFRQQNMHTITDFALWNAHHLCKWVID